MLCEGVEEKKKKEREGKEEGMTCPRRPPNRQGHDGERRAGPCPSLELNSMSSAHSNKTPSQGFSVGAKFEGRTQ